MSGTIGVFALETGRYTAFSIALSGLDQPDGSVQRWVLGSDMPTACNKLATGLHGDWLWIMGDDHTFRPDVLRRLIAHDVDIVSPLCLSRRTPFNPYAYWKRDGMVPVNLEDLPDHGLVEVEVAGSAGMLIRRRVFETLSEPWFEHGPEGEDVAFCDKARKAGFRLFYDCGTTLGHISTAILWPTRLNGEWVNGITVADGFQIATAPQPCIGATE